VSRRRLRRRDAKAHRHAPPRKAPAAPVAVVREAAWVERLAYTRTQAAAALGVSRSTFDHRVLPLVERIEMPWGTHLIPVDELERLVDERRRPARGRANRARGRRVALAPEVADRIHAEHVAGKSLGQIARDLNATRTPTAHGGAQWWPSTVRAVLQRTSSTLPTLVD
jgi:hypothetical protein